MPLAVNRGSAWAGHREELAAAVGTENSWNRYFFGNNHFSVGNKTRMMGRNLWGVVVMSSSQKWEGGMMPALCWREMEGSVHQSRAWPWKMSSLTLH